MSVEAPRHGTPSGYRHDKCRCDECCEANTVAVKDWRKRAGPIPRQYPALVLTEDDDPALIDGRDDAS